MNTLLHNELEKEKTIYDINSEEEYLSCKDKVDINHVRNSLGYNCLFSADSEKAKWLIKQGINLQHKDASGINALFGSDLEKTKLLVESGIDIYCVDKEGKNALFYINRDILELLEREYMDFDLIMVSSDPDDKDCAEKVIKSNLSILSYLLDAGLDKTIAEINKDSFLRMKLIEMVATPHELNLFIEYGFLIPEEYDIEKQKRSVIREVVITHRLQREREALQIIIESSEQETGKNRL